MEGRLEERVYIRPSTLRVITMQKPKDPLASWVVTLEDFFEGEKNFEKVKYEGLSFQEALEAFAEAISNASEEWERNRPR